MQGSEGLPLHAAAAVLHGRAGHLQRVLRHPARPGQHLQHARRGRGHHERGPPQSRLLRFHGDVRQEPLLHRYVPEWQMEKKEALNGEGVFSRVSDFLSPFQ
jgi:hypothetical protein